MPVLKMSGFRYMSIRGMKLMMKVRFIVGV